MWYSGKAHSHAATCRPWPPPAGSRCGRPARNRPVLCFVLAIFTGWYSYRIWTFKARPLWLTL